MMDRRENSEAATGMAMLAIAAVLWSLNGAFIKEINAGGNGPPGILIALYRSLFAGLFLFPLAWRHWSSLGRVREVRSPFRLAQGWRPRPTAIVSAITFTVLTATFVISATMTTAANAIILQYTSTFWVFVLSPMITGERPDRRDFPLLAAALLGVGIIFVGSGPSDLAGLALALVAGLSFGVLTLVLRRLRTAHAAAVTVWNNLAAAALLAVGVLAVRPWLPPSTSMEFALRPREYGLLALMGAVQLGLPYLLFAAGLRRVPAHRAAMVILLEPLLVPVWTYFLAGEVVSKATMIGGVFIFGALVALLVRTSVRGRSG